MTQQRYSNPFILNNRDHGLNQGEGMIDLSKAGTRQFAPDLYNIAGNSPYVRRNVIPFLIEVPPFFRFASDKDLLAASLKALLETHTRTVDGLNQTITVENGESPVGGSGESLKTPTNVTREVSAPTHGCWELQGRSITKFIKWWIRYGIGDENTKVPLIVSNGGVDAADYNATFYGATVLYVEPDPTMTEVVDAWLCTNFFPTATPTIEGTKDVAQLGQTLEISLEFACTTDVSQGTKNFARQLLQSINLQGLNPNENPAWLEGLGADVSAADSGLADRIEAGASRRLAF